MKIFSGAENGSHFWQQERFWQGLVFASLLFLAAVIFFQPVHLTTSDLGRHLANGREVFSHPELLTSNFYSYTAPERPFVNHHWLAGLCYYSLFLLGGFPLLTIFNILLVLAAFWLAFRLAKRYAGFWLPAIMSVPVILLLSERVEIRPEIFSYFFIFLLWNWLETARRNKNYRQLWRVPILMLIWANTHIYFFAGLVLIAIYAAALFGEKLLSWLATPGEQETVSWQAGLRLSFRASRPFWLAFLAAVLATLINPNTWRGLVYPFRILDNYGYEIAENKTVWFLQNINLSTNYQIFWVLLSISVLSIILAAFKFRKNLVGILSLAFFGLLGLFAVRNISLFGLAFLVAASMNFSVLKDFPAFVRFQILGRRLFPVAGALVFLSVVAASLYFFISPLGQNRFLKTGHGWGVDEAGTGSARFFIEKGLSGPLFNNYDIGSALIFWLSDREKVFVDNRPEAYGEEFFNGVYRPLQQDEQAWKKFREQYGFRAIYFAYTDSTPWARQFISARLADPEWALVYFDPYALIMLPKEQAAEKGLATIDFWAFRQDLRAQSLSAGIGEQFNLATLAELAGQGDLAGEIYSRVLARYPDNTSALLSYSFYFSQQGSREGLQTALYYLNLAHQTGYDLPSFYNQRGLLYWNLDQPVEAVSNWRQALKKNKHDADALYYLEQVSDLQAAGQLSLPE